MTNDREKLESKGVDTDGDLDPQKLIDLAVRSVLDDPTTSVGKYYAESDNFVVVSKQGFYVYKSRSGEVDKFITAEELLEFVKDSRDVTAIVPRKKILNHAYVAKRRELIEMSISPTFATILENSIYGFGHIKEASKVIYYTEEERNELVKEVNEKLTSFITLDVPIGIIPRKDRPIVDVDRTTLQMHGFTSREIEIILDNNGVYSNDK